MPTNNCSIERPGCGDSPPRSGPVLKRGAMRSLPENRAQRLCGEEWVHEETERSDRAEAFEVAGAFMCGSSAKQKFAPRAV